MNLPISAMDWERNREALQSAFNELAHLFISSSRLSTLDDSEIGIGGYGKVCRATLDGSSIVAVKELLITQASGTRVRVAMRLARELKVWAEAKHPNVLELVGYYLSEDYVRAQLISPYIANGNVTEYIKKTQADVGVRLRLVRGITSGIEYLHTCSPAICHGDLKPANVLISDEPNAVLCDFGLATFVEASEASSGLTTSRSTKGSTRYMSPELFLDDEAPHTLDSDVWAWGCTTFEIITDCTPFSSSQNNRSLMFAIVQGQPPGSMELLPDVDIPFRPTLDALQRLIPNCWNKDPKQRPSSSYILKQLNRFNHREARPLPRPPGDTRSVSLPTMPPSYMAKRNAGTEVTQAAPKELQQASSTFDVPRSSKLLLKGEPTATNTSVIEQLKHGPGSPSVWGRSQLVKERFVVLVFIRYTGWYCVKEERSISMQLDSVANDFVHVLNYLRYRHDDEETMWHLLTDIDLEYTDETGNTRVLQRTTPTREAILNGLTEAGETGRSGLVYFCAHSEYGPPGNSVLEKNGERMHYAVNVPDWAEPRASCILAIDGGRIYGEDIFPRLPEAVGTECVHTVALDTSHSRGVASQLNSFFKMNTLLITETDAATSLHHVYNGESGSSSGAESLEVLAEAADSEQRSSKQLVVISAAREGELARTVRPGVVEEYGMLTWYLIDWLKRYPFVTVKSVAQRLRYRCVESPPEGRQQHPEILARHHLTDSFKLLP